MAIERKQAYLVPDKAAINRHFDPFDPVTATTVGPAVYESLSMQVHSGKVMTTYPSQWMYPS